MKKKLKLPKFKNEDEERKFWDRVDLSEYLESEDLQAVSFPNLKPSSRAISIRIPETLLLRLKEEANRLHVPYQALIKKYVSEGLKGENPSEAA